MQIMESLSIISMQKPLFYSNSLPCKIMRLAQEPVLSRFMTQIMMYGDHMMQVQASMALILKLTGTLSTLGQQFQLMEIAQSLLTRSISVSIAIPIMMMQAMIVHGTLTAIGVVLKIIQTLLLEHIAVPVVVELQQQPITGIQLMVSGMMQWETKELTTKSE